MAGLVIVSSGCRGGESDGRRAKGEEEQQEESQLSLIALLLAAIRRSMVSCRVDRRKDVIAAVRQMEIGRPTNVRHVTHVTFDRFNGFLGLPVEFELEIPCRVPSASASVFGVSPESMQCCYDSKGNSVPTILLLMQERLYAQGGLKAEGIFRINPENSQEEHVRDQLNKGIVPDDIDVHCLAGLIKAWFRELPDGVLDGLSPEQVLQCNTEEESVELVKLLLPTQAALLNWAVDLMADVVEEEDVNKMNARNIAMVFAPNMTQMSDPLTALMHAVQVMNLLKTLILKTLREREEASMEGYSPFSGSPLSHGQSEDGLDRQTGVDVSGELGQNSEYGNAEYCQDEVDVSGELRDGDHVSYSHSMVDEAESLEEIEECFLRQLEWNEESGDACEPIGGADTGVKEATQLSSSVLGAASAPFLFGGKEGRSSTKLSSSELNDACLISMVGSKEGSLTQLSSSILNDTCLISMVGSKEGNSTQLSSSILNDTCLISVVGSKEGNSTQLSSSDLNDTSLISLVGSKEGNSTQLSNSDLNDTCLISMVGSKEGSLSTSGEEWEASFSTGDASFNSKSSFKRLEHCIDKEICECHQKQIS